MKKLILIFIISISQQPIMSQSMAAEEYYIAAFNEISDMLSGRDSLSVKEVHFLLNGLIMKGI